MERTPSKRIPVPTDRVRNRLKRGSRGGRPPKSDKDDYKQRHSRSGT
ncbi:hypothetical protein ACWIG3_32955 [Streptomyces celluloflavus]|uniref:Uncharacterized protein n=1 Tax=Streptomyces celluloflavus TaxID=58344 RepID=A0ABW7RH12_9ACTN|nr:hypothetical protein [Streptomyces sp. SID7805]